MWESEELNSTDSCEDEKTTQKKEGKMENSKRMSLPDPFYPVLAEVNPDQVKTSAPNLDVSNSNQ